MADNTTSEDARLQIERERLEIERHKMEIEQKKLELEISKKWSTIVAIAVPILVVAATIWGGFRNSEMQAREAFRLEAAKAIVAPELQADRVVRVNLLQALFADELGKNFATTFNNLKVPDEADITPRLNFMKLVTAQGLNSEETGKLFMALFGGKDGKGDLIWWTPEVREILADNTKRTATHK